MGTIKEDYVSFEIAQLLRDKGFEGVVHAYYNIWDNGNKVCPVEEFSHSEAPHLYIPCPTIQMVMAWLREEYRLEIYPYHNNLTIYNDKWWFEIIEYPNTVAEYESGKDEEFDTYQEACQAAIKYCLENLIK